MKMLKTRKILILLISLLALVFTSMAFIGNFTAKAEVKGSDYFSYEDKSADPGDIVFEDNLAKIKMFDGKALSFKNELVVDDFGLELYLGNDFTETSIILELPSLDKNGNYLKKDSSETFEKKVKNVLTFKLEEGALKASFNGLTEQVIASSFDAQKLLTVKFELAKGSCYLTSSVAYGEGTAVDLKVDNYGADVAEYYKVSNEQMPVANVVIDQKPTGENSLIKIASISQKTADDNFKQTFEMENEEFKTKAYHRVVIDGGLFNYNESAHVYTVFKGTPYSLTMVGKSFVEGNVKSGYVFVSGSNINGEAGGSGEAGVLVNGLNVAFVGDGEQVLHVKNSDSSKVYETFKFAVVDSQGDDVAPVYTANENALKAFNNKLNSLIYEFDSEGNKKTKLAIGSGEYLTLTADMFRSLVSDNVSSFDKLSHVIYYWAPGAEEQTVTTYKIPLTKEGVYTFYVLFTDQAGNSMDKDNFYTVSVEDSNVVIDREYKGFMFTFSIEDNTTLSISASTPGYGYTGIEYNASSFKIVGSDHTEVYKLFYSETDIAQDDEGWVEIVKKESATDENENYNGYTYDEIQSIAYDGKLNFVPNKIGFYKLVCTTYSKMSSDSAEKAVVIEVKDQVKTVKPDSKWFENNVWSVVFLGVGTLCLVAIIVILCIKPKNPEDVE